MTSQDLDSPAHSVLRSRRWSPGYASLTTILFLGDAVAAGAASLFAPQLWETFDGNFRPTTGLPVWQFAGSAIWVLALRFFGAGDVASGHFAWRTLSAVAKTSLTALIATLSVFYLAPFFVPRGVALVGVALTMLFVLLSRAAYLRLLARHVLRSRVAVVGTDPAAVRAAQAMRRSSRVEYEVKAFLAPNGNSPSEIGGVPVLSLGGGLWTVLANLDVDQLVVGHTSALPSEVLEQLVNCFDHGIQAVPATVKFEELTGRVMVAAMEADWYADLPTYAYSPYGIWKRALEVLVIVMSLPLVVPLCIVIAALTCVDSGGPLFYRQVRVGRRGTPFVIHKFRSMRTNAEPEGQAVWATPNDERVTRIGRALRRTRLDELPQLWDVVRGQMSLIGPRPERPEFVERLAADLPLYRARSLVKPGMTGWAQVQYPYAASIEDNLAKLEYDLYYIRHVGWTLDVSIALRTLPIIFSLRGR